MQVLILCVLALALSGCGKSLDQIRTAGHSLLDIGFKVYEDVKDNVETVKQVIVEPGVPPVGSDR